MRDDLMTIYSTHPMQDGDVVLLVEDLQLATEIEGLADHWDDVLCRNTAHVLKEIEAPDVEVAIARRGGELRERDHRLLRELRQELAGSGIIVRPLVVLPAA